MPTFCKSRALAFPLAAAALLACALLAPSPAAAQKKKKNTPAADAAPTATPVNKHLQRSLLTFDQYENLLNILFPIDRDHPVGLDYTMVLRFESLEHPESQITIRYFHNGRAEATLSRVADGNAWRAAAGHVDNPLQPDYAAIAKAVDIRSSKILLPDRQVQAWHKELFPVIEKEFSHVRSVDKKILKGTTPLGVSGTRYELFYLQSDDEVQVTSWDAEISALPTGTEALAKWMNSIRFFANNNSIAMPPPDQAPALIKR